MGYCFGKLYAGGSDAGRKQTLLIGAFLILLFIILRATNVYGDPLKWSKQPTGIRTFLSFINTQKYQPSLLYICMTLGPALLILGSIQTVRTRLGRAITVYGRVPFLYYILHFYILHLIAAFMFIYRGHSLEEGVNGIERFPFRFIVPGEGYSLFIVYLIWLAVVVLLYPICRWFSRYKQHHRNWWLSYL